METDTDSDSRFSKNTEAPVEEKNQVTEKHFSFLYHKILNCCCCWLISVVCTNIQMFHILGQTGFRSICSCDHCLLFNIIIKSCAHKVYDTLFCFSVYK